MKEKTKEIRFFDVNDVCKILGVGKSKAYQTIRKLNKELESNGYLIVSGKIPKKYFLERIYG